MGSRLGELKKGKLRDEHEKRFGNESAKMEAGFKNEENERRKVHNTLTFMEEIKTMKMGGRCAISSAASTGYGLGTGTFTRPPPLGQNWKEIWVPRKLEVKGWVTLWSKRQIIGPDDDQIKGVLDQLAELMTKEAKDCIDWTQSKENQGLRLKNTQVGLWCTTDK